METAVAMQPRQETQDERVKRILAEARATVNRIDNTIGNVEESKLNATKAQADMEETLAKINNLETEYKKVTDALFDKFSKSMGVPPHLLK